MQGGIRVTYIHNKDYGKIRWMAMDKAPDPFTPPFNELGSRHYRQYAHWRVVPYTEHPKFRELGFQELKDLVHKENAKRALERQTSKRE